MGSLSSLQCKSRHTCKLIHPCRPTSALSLILAESGGPVACSSTIIILCWTIMKD